MTEIRTWWVVTGGTSGIGAAVVERGVRDGHHVLAIGRREMTDTEHVRYLNLDLTHSDCGAVVRKALELEWNQTPGNNQLGGLVHSAAISHGKPASEIDDASWFPSFQVNVDAVMRINQALIPLLKQAGGAIVHVGSPVSIVGAKKVSYAASKGALLGLNIATAVELAPNVRVNAILPGPTLTEMTSDWTAEQQQERGGKTLIGRMATPAEMAGPIAFLLSSDASFITGEVLNVSGGGYPGI